MQITPKNNILIGVIVAIVIAASVNVDANPIEFVGGLSNLTIIAEEIQIEAADLSLFQTAFFFNV